MYPILAENVHPFDSSSESLLRACALRCECAPFLAELLSDEIAEPGQPGLSQSTWDHSDKEDQDEQTHRCSPLCFGIHHCLGRGLSLCMNQALRFLVPVQQGDDCAAARATMPGQSRLMIG